MSSSENDISMLYFFYSELFMQRQVLTGIYHESIGGYPYSVEVLDANRFENWGYTDLISKVVSGNDQNIDWKREYLQISDSLGIRPKIYPSKRTWVYDIIDESRFSDLLIISYDVFQRLIKQHINQWNKLSKKALCPIIIAPKDQRPIKNVIFVYDGTAQSARAIKNFSLLFSFLKNTRSAYVISTACTSTLKRHDEEKALMNYARLYLPGVAFFKNAGANILEIIDFAAKIENHILVMGYNGDKNPVQAENLFSLSSSLDNTLFVSH